MAKLKGPLMSLGATQQLAKTLVFFPWKGLNVVREYVIPANPNTTGQSTQRGYLTEAVDKIHGTQALAAFPLNAGDVIAYSALANIEATPRTWFNQVCAQNMAQRVASKRGAIYRAGTTTPGAAQLVVGLKHTKVSGANDITAGTIYWGTSRTALISSMAATIVAEAISATIVGLTTGVKYFWQFRATLHGDYGGTRSGIYHGTPT